MLKGLNKSNISFTANLTLNHNLTPAIKDDAREFKNKIYNPLKQKLAELPNTKKDTLELALSYDEFGQRIVADYNADGLKNPIRIETFPVNILIKNAKDFIERIMEGIHKELKKLNSRSDNESALEEMGLPKA